MFGLRLNSVRSWYVLAGFLSLLLSFWLSARESVINPDAICYLQSAADMQLGLHTAMRVCSQASWPFYSMIIYGFARLLHLSYVNSAYMLDAIFSLISVCSFLAIVRTISKKPSIFWLGMLVILCAHEFNAVRQYIVRDHGFWAFYLLSLLFLLHYFKKPQWRYAIAWSVSLVVATLFRVEGAIYLLLVPMVCWLNAQQTWVLRMKSYFQLNSLTLFGALVLGLGIAFKPHLDLTRLHEVQFQFLHGVSSIVQHFAELKQRLGEHILNSDSIHDSGTVLFLMLSSWYLFSVIANLAFVYAALVVYAWAKRLFPADYQERLVIWAYVVVGIIVTATFFVEHLFLSKRYLIALSLVLMIWVPFALEYLLLQWRSKKALLVVTALLMLATTVSGIIDFGYSKRYIHDAGYWLAVNVPKNSNLYSNDYQLMYYSEHFGDSIFTKAKEYIDLRAVADNKWKRYDYLAIRVNKKELNERVELLKQIDYTLVQVFANKRGDQVRIYRRI